MNQTALNTQLGTPKKASDYLATYGMWLASAALAVYEISLVREFVTSLYAWWLVLSDRSVQVRSNFEATSLAQIVTLVMGVLAIVIIIGGFEYHHKRVGDRKARKVLLWTLGVQLAVLALGWIVIAL